MQIMWWCSFLHHKPQPIQLPAVFRAGGHDIDPGGFDAAVAQNVRQLGDVLFHAVEGAGKELTQIVGEYLAGIHPGGFAERLHLLPDVAPVQGISPSGAEEDAGVDPLPFCVIQQQPFQLPRHQDPPGFALAPDGNLPGAHRFHGEVFQLRDPDAGGADGLQDQIQPGLLPGRGQQPQIVFFGQLPVFPAVGLPLAPQDLYLAVLPAQEGQQAVHACQHGVYRPEGIIFLHKLLLVGDHQLLGHRFSCGVGGKGSRVPEIFLHRGGAFFFFQ